MSIVSSAEKTGLLPLIETLGFSNYILQKMSAWTE